MQSKQLKEEWKYGRVPSPYILIHISDMKIPRNINSAKSVSQRKNRSEGEREEHRNREREREWQIDIEEHKDLINNGNDILDV